MDLTFNDQELAFRDELRDWLEANPPGDEPATEAGHFAWRRGSRHGRRRTATTGS